MMLRRACMGAGDDVLEIALGLHADWQRDQKSHRPDDGEQNQT